MNIPVKRASFDSSSISHHHLTQPIFQVLKGAQNEVLSWGNPPTWSFNPRKWGYLILPSYIWTVPQENPLTPLPLIND